MCHKVSRQMIDNDLFGGGSIFELPPVSSKTEWASVLHLAHTWNFEFMRAYAIGKLAALTTPVDRIVLGKKYAIDHWLHSAYQVVCERQACLSDEEGARLGLADVLRISRARQDMRIPAPLRSSEIERSRAFCETFGIQAPIPLTPAALAPQFELPVTQEEPMTPVATLSALLALTQPTHVTPSAIHVSGEIVTTSERDCATPQPSYDDKPSEPELIVLAPISDPVRDRLQDALVKIKNADEATEKARKALETAEPTLKAAETALGSSKAVNNLKKIKKHELLCAVARADVDANQCAIASNGKSAEQAHSTIVALALADVKVDLRPHSYQVPADMRAALSQLLSTINSTREALFHVRSEEFASRRNEDDNEYIKSWKRMHTNNPTTDSAQALEDARRQVELSKVRCARKIAAAEDVIATSQRKLAQLLTQVAVAATAS
jgi:hypothetical protein